jgi:hypothetical protein
MTEAGRGNLADSYSRGSQGERRAMMVFWDCDGLRSVDALRATVEESLEVYIWILAASFEGEGGRFTVSGGIVFTNI